MPSIYNSIRNNGAVVEQPDYILTRMACYSIAMEADNRKPEVKLAKQYMLISILENEKRKQYINNQQRIDMRDAYSEYENSLESTYAQHGVKPGSYGYVKSTGDKGFYDNPGGTKTVKEELGIPNNKPLADYMDFETLTFKSMANIKTKYGIINKDLNGTEECASEAFEQNAAQRKDMKEVTGDYPEDRMPVERIGTVKKDNKQLQQNIIKNSMQNTLKDSDPRLFTVFEYQGYIYTLAHWCYMNNVDPYYTLSLLDQGIPFEQAIFMRPSGKGCPLIILESDK